VSAASFTSVTRARETVLASANSSSLLRGLNEQAIADDVASKTNRTAARCLMTPNV
jgi:hypothetical protein